MLFGKQRQEVALKNNNNWMLISGTACTSKCGIFRKLWAALTIKPIRTTAHNDCVHLHVESVGRQYHQTGFLFMHLSLVDTLIMFPGNHQPRLASRTRLESEGTTWPSLSHAVKYYHMRYITSQNAICKEALSLTLRVNSNKKKQKGAEIAANQA